MITNTRAKKIILFISKSLLLAGTLGVVYVFSGFLGLQLALKNREVTVPSLISMSAEEASVALKELNLTVGLESLRQPNQAIAAGLIADQSPNPGIQTRQNRQVKIWLSSGKTPGSAPLLAGESETAARQRLVNNSFNLVGLSEIRSEQYQTDSIVAQEQSSRDGEENVRLLVNRGERGRTYVMPDLIGISATTAAEILRSQGFRITVVGEHPYPGLEGGIILRHSPQSGFQIAPGESISLEVSQ